MSGHWIEIASHEDLARRGAMVVRVGGRQIALFDTPRGPRACNNRCPHEGYPLSEGSLDSKCVLTCNWHNWKFDLESGDNLYGGDRLRTYPVSVRGDAVWVDLAEPPFEERRDAALAALHDAFDDGDYARMARELGRLNLMRADLLDAVRAALEWSFERMEFGFTHGYAGLADWLLVHDEHPDDEEVRLACLLEGIAHIADDVLREPRHAFPQGVEAWDEDGFVAAVEAEDEAAAAARIRGALQTGLGLDALDGALARAALAHYNAFGHSVIYVTKARRLVERLGVAVAGPVLLALVRHLVFARREDLIPEFRGYAKALTAFGTGSSTVEPDGKQWRGLGIDRALSLTVAASGTSPETLFHALLEANAANLLRFDLSRQQRVRVPVSDSVTWLDLTHGITFAEAARRLCERHPRLWPAASLQMACFSGRNARYTLDDDLLEAWAVPDREAFFQRRLEQVLDHEEDEYIVAVHRLKTLVAARALLGEALPVKVADVLLAAVNRYLSSPMRLKQVRRTVYQAMQSVARDG